MITYINGFTLVLFLIIILIIIDQNVYDYIILLFKYLNIKIRTIIWYSLNHPRIYNNPLMKFFSYLKYYSIAKELKKELENERKEDI